MSQKSYKITRGTGPIVVAAIHDGHGLRDEVAKIIALSDSERLREEDPCTGEWTTVADTRIIGLRSRFEVDLNRPREKAVYRIPADAWGLHVWETAPSDAVVAESLGQYDEFYEEVRTALAKLQKENKHVVVYDLHTYNHRRDGHDKSPADASLNPEVNIGTGTMNRDRWGPLVDRFMSDLHAFDFQGRQLDVRENVKFQGGQFSRWIHEQFPETVCSIAIEFKKFFMDEWTGEPDTVQVSEIKKALLHTIPGVRKEIERLDKSNA